jgi:hypothetical protein
MAEFKGDSMIIDGIAASEAIDSSGEILDVKGCDISDFTNGVGLINWEHSSTKSADDQNPLQIIGKIIYGKKIFKESDCEDERQKFYWKQVELPYIYIRVRLYDGSGHPGAMAAAAMIRDHVKNGEKILLRYSIEGSTLERSGNRLLRSVARRVAATIKPCNRSCDSGILYDPQGTDGAIKNTEILAEKLLGAKKEESTKKTEFVHPGYMKLGASPELEVDAGYLTKTMTAGMPSAAPSTLVGGDALQRAPKGFRHEYSAEETREAVKKAIKKKMLESLLSKAEGEDEEEDDEPDLSEDEKKALANSRVRIIYNDANGNPLGKPMIVDEESFNRFFPHQRQFTKEKGRPAFSPQAGVHFDSTTGILHTPVASMPLYIPNDEGYEKILNDPKILAAHGEAMKNWGRLHNLLKEGKLNPQVLMYASLFSGLSPNNPVPMQEIAFSHLVDMIKEGIIDPTKLKDKFDWSKLNEKGGAKQLEAEIKASPEYQEFQRRVSGYSDRKKPPADAQGLPKHARSYWSGSAGEPTRYVEEPSNKNKAKSSGVYQKGLFGPLGKFKSVVGFGLYMSILGQLVQKHGTNGRAIARALHSVKSAGDSKRARAQLADIPELQGIVGDLADHTAVSVMGLAPKTIRYALGMMGFGDMPVPDTHWTRHAFDLERDKVVRERILVGLNNMLNDGTASAKDKKVAQTFLKKMAKDKESATDFAKMFLPHHHVREVMWAPQNHDEMMKLDDYYEKLHPAIRKTAERLFGDPKKTKDAVFPGFWLHWLTINAHEASKGRAKAKVYNEGTHHIPYFMVMDQLHKDLGIEPLTEDYDKPYDPESHMQQLDVEHEAVTGTKERIAAPPKELKPRKIKESKPKKPKKISANSQELGKSEEEHISPDHLQEMKKLVTANLAMEKQLGEAYGQFYFYHQVLPRLLRMGDMAKAEESESSEESSSSEGSSSSAERTEGSWNKEPEKEGLPKVSEDFLDAFEDVTDDIDKIKLGKMTKTELWMHEMFLMSTLKKAQSPDAVEEHHLHPDTHPEHKGEVLGMELVPKDVSKFGFNPTKDSGIMKDASFWGEAANGHPTYIKGELLAAPEMRPAAEAATVDLARQLGLGQYFPHTSLIDGPQGKQALIRGIVGLKKASELSSSRHQILHKVQDPVDMQKLALFDGMIGNADRHNSNYGFSPDGKIQMFDHGIAFHPDFFDTTVSPAVAARLGINLTPVGVAPPDYLPHMDLQKRPEVIEWMQRIDPQAVIDTMNRYGLVAHPKHEQAVRDTIQRMKDAMLDRRTSIDDLFA